MKKILIYLLFILPITLFAQDKAHKIIAKSIKAHGGKAYDNFAVSLDFRQYHLVLKQNKTLFQYERTMTDSTNTVQHDVLNNDGFYREINGQKLDLSKEDAQRFSGGVNSQAYFLFLPYKLSDKAVILNYLGEATVDGQKQYKIQVSFQKEGGGKDYEDVFCYWINQKTYLIDYIAYSEGGPRFRKATLRQTVAGIVFQDYDNYEIKDKKASTSEYDRIYTEGGAKLLSKIEHTHFKVVKGL